MESNKANALPKHKKIGTQKQRANMRRLHKAAHKAWLKYSRLNREFIAAVEEMHPKLQEEGFNGVMYFNRDYENRNQDVVLWNPKYTTISDMLHICEHAAATLQRDQETIRGEDVDPYLYWSKHARSISEKFRKEQTNGNH